MDELQLYVIGIIIIVAVFAAILKRVFAELDKHGDFVKNKKDMTANFTKEEILSLSNNEDEKCKEFCKVLDEIFIEFTSQIPNENDKEKARALRTVLNSISSLSSSELKDKLLQLLPEFEECIKNALGDEKAADFVNKAGAEYNKIFKD